MEKLLSNKWDSLVLDELKNEAIIKARNKNETLRTKAFYLYDNPKMDEFKGDVVKIENGFMEIVLISKELFTKTLETDEYEYKDRLVDKAVSLMTSVVENKNIPNTSKEDFIAWAEKNDLNKVLINLDLSKKSKLKP